MENSAKTISNIAEKTAGKSFKFLSAVMLFLTISSDRVKALSDLLIEPTSHERLLAVILSNNYIPSKRRGATTGIRQIMIHKI